MKFFSKKSNHVKKNKQEIVNEHYKDEKIYEKIGKSITLNDYKSVTVTKLGKMVNRGGLLTKSKLCFMTIIQNMNFFLYFKKNFLLENYKNVEWILENIFFKKLNCVWCIDILAELIKPPFVVKTTVTPKKLKKKTKAKYSVKVVYKNDAERIKSSFKQLYYHTNTFKDGAFKLRMYKTITNSFLEWKDSDVYKYKLNVFKKFFKV